MRSTCKLNEARSKDEKLKRMLSFKIRKLDFVKKGSIQYEAKHLKDIEAQIQEMAIKESKV